MQVTTPAPTDVRGATTAPRARRGKLIKWQPAWMFMAPSLAILGIFVLWPILELLWYSFHDWTIGADNQPWVGVDNYVKLTQDPQFWGALGNTIEITVVSIAFILFLGFIVAVSASGEGIGTRIVRSVFFFPTVVSLTAVGLAFRFFVDPDIGILSGLAQSIGLQPIALLTSTTLALPTVIAVSVWKSIGFAMIVIVAGLKGIPQELYEAARIDGAGPVALTRHVTIPGLRPTLLFVTLILTIQSLQIFDLVYVMTGGGPLFTTETLVTKLIRDGFVNFKTGYAASMSWVLVLLVVIVTAIQLRFFRYNDAD